MACYRHLLKLRKPLVLCALPGSLRIWPRVLFVILLYVVSALSSVSNVRTFFAVDAPSACMMPLMDISVEIVADSRNLYFGCIGLGYLIHYILLPHLLC